MNVSYRMAILEDVVIINIIYLPYIYMDVINDIEVLETDIEDCDEKVNALIVLLYMKRL